MKRIRWLGASREDIRRFPESAKLEAGYQLYRVQLGMDLQGLEAHAGDRGRCPRDPGPGRGHVPGHLRGKVSNIRTYAKGVLIPSPSGRGLG